MKKILLAFLTVLLMAPVCSNAGTIWDESVDGDLSNGDGAATNVGLLDAGASDILGYLDAGTTSTTSGGPDEFDVIQFTTSGPWTFDVIDFSAGSSPALVLFLQTVDGQHIDSAQIISPSSDLFGTRGAGTFRLFHIPLGNMGTLSYTSRINMGPAIKPVIIDIKPGSDPNCFNVNGHGVIPVAVFGSDTFDVTLIDQDSLSFGGLAVRVRGKNGTQCSMEYSNGDDNLDLVCHFEDKSGNWLEGGDATLAGTLFDGTVFEGTDSICVTQVVP